MRGARGQLVPAEGARGPAATHSCGATERCGGGARQPRPQTSFLFLHPAGGQRTSSARGNLMLYQDVTLNLNTLFGICLLFVSAQG